LRKTIKGVVSVADVRIAFIYDRERGIMLIETQEVGRFKRGDNVKNIVWERTCPTGLNEPDGYTGCKEVLEYKR
jgi:hypothetical protein